MRWGLRRVESGICGELRWQCVGRIGAAQSAVRFGTQRRMTPSAFALRATADKPANPRLAR
jgi:hypothetical protein